jgi:hypothetical protein
MSRPIGGLSRGGFGGFGGILLGRVSAERMLDFNLSRGVD